MHLHGDILEQYRSRTMPPQTLGAIDAHVSNCLFCAHALADDGATSARWERRGWLGRLALVETPVGLDENRGELRSAA
jgi:hypothetical protein